MTRAELRAIACGLLHDGLNVRLLTPTGREEIRRALDVLLEQAEREERKKAEALAAEPRP